jgi:hypothetical protein
MPNALLTFEVSSSSEAMIQVQRGPIRIVITIEFIHHVIGLSASSLPLVLGFGAGPEKAMSSVIRTYLGLTTVENARPKAGYN